MTREEIIAKVNSVLAEEFEVEESTLTPDASIKNITKSVKAPK